MKLQSRDIDLLSKYWYLRKYLCFTQINPINLPYYSNFLFLFSEDKHQFKSRASSSFQFFSPGGGPSEQASENNIITIIIDVRLNIKLLLKAPSPPFLPGTVVYTFFCPAVFLSLIQR